MGTHKTSTLCGMGSAIVNTLSLQTHEKRLRLLRQRARQNEQKTAQNAQETARHNRFQPKPIPARPSSGTGVRKSPWRRAAFAGAAMLLCVGCAQQPTAGEQCYAWQIDHCGKVCTEAPELLPTLASVTAGECMPSGKPQAETGAGGRVGEEETNVENYKKPSSLGKFHITEYYTPVRGQRRYYNGSYEADYRVNCSGDCLQPAMGGIYYKNITPYTVAACPPEIGLGTRLHIEGFGEVLCTDRGGSIKAKRLDLWAGIGDAGLDRVYGAPHFPSTHSHIIHKH